VPESATYVYCLVQSAQPPAVKGAPEGMPGSGPPRVLPVNGHIWAIVADAPLDRFSGEVFQQELQDIEAVSRHALAHASMIEFFFQRHVVIPLKLFTLFSQDDRARRQLAGRGTTLRGLFAALRGLEEWGVRITAAVRPRASAAAASTPASGRDYLEVKKRMAEELGAPSRGTKAEVAAAMKALGALAVKVRAQDLPAAGRGGPYVTGASLLVKATRRGEWKKRVAQVSGTLEKQGHRLDVNGPWPPYHFASGVRPPRAPRKARAALPTRRTRSSKAAR
jgi:hypothetical protein